jgi:hypothetical protein
MAENIPSLPGGAVPPQPPEGSKVQPKKETVRINLPPKPSAAPTIKLPTLPPGGPSSAPGAVPFPPAAAAAPAAAVRSTAAAPAAAAPAQQRPAPRAAAPPPAPAVSGLDKILAIVAAVAALAAVGTTAYCMMLFK